MADGVTEATPAVARTTIAKDDRPRRPRQIKPVVEDIEEGLHQGAAQETARNLARAIEADPDPLPVAPMAVAARILAAGLRLQAVRKAYAVPDVAEAGQALKHLVIARLPTLHA